MIYKIAIIASLLFIIFIIALVRNKKLHEKYSILWFFLAIVIIVISLAYEVLDKFSISIGIYYSPALLFLVGIIFLVIYIIHISTVITKQSKDIIRLNQEIAILSEKLEKSNNK